MWSVPEKSCALLKSTPSGPPACGCQLLPSTGEAAAGGDTQPQTLLSSQCPPAPGEGRLSARTALTGGLILSAMEGSSTEAGPKGLPLPTSRCGGHYGQRTTSACCNFIMGTDCRSASQNTCLPEWAGKSCSAPGRAQTLPADWSTGPTCRTGLPRATDTSYRLDEGPGANLGALYWRKSRRGA